MKNLKKVLALVLCVAMVMGLALTSSAAKFSDPSTIKNTEAVDVVSELGIINGFSDGTYKGTENVTRAQMAKMICFVLNSGDDVGNYYSAINAFTDCSSHWAKGYIAYCAKMSIVAGVGSGKFAPDGSVTGTQAAKMLLVALGYDPTNEGYVGKSWATNVLKDAKDAGLLKNMGKIDMTAPLSRDAAAQMIYNSLKATMVEYKDSATKITIGDATINTSASDATSKTSSDNQYKNIDDSSVTVSSEKQYYMELGEDCFDTLKLATTKDDMGNPADKWTYKSKTVGTYANKPDNTAVVADKNKTLNDILTSSSYMDYDNDNIEYADTDSSKDNVQPYIYINGALQASASITLQKGDVVNAFENDDSKVSKVVIARYQLAKIDSVDTNLGKTEKDHDAAYRLKLVDLDGNSIGNGTYYDTYNDDDNKYTVPNFASDTYKEDAVLAIAVKSDNRTIVDSYVAPVVKEVLSTAKSDTTDNHITTDGYVTAGGTKYYFAGQVTAANGVTDDFSFSDAYSIYTTKEGYVIGLDGSTTSDLSDLYYVTGFYKETSAGSESYYAQRVAMNGKVDVVKLEKGTVQSNGLYSDISTEIKSWDKNGVYTFSDDKVPEDADKSYDKQKANDGKLTLEPLDIDNDAYKDYRSTDVKAANVLSGAVKTGDTTLKAKIDGSDKTYHVNSSTEYLSVEKLGDKIDVTSTIGGMKAADATKVVVVYDPDDTKTALAVIYYGDSLSTSASTDKVLYLKDAVSVHSANDTWTGSAYFMDTNKLEEGVVFDDDYAAGFWTYSVDDNVYKLEAADELTPTTAAYDDDEGALTGVTINDYYKQVSFSGEVNGNKTYLVNVPYKSVMFVDDRGDDKDDDAYGNEILNAGLLGDAIDEGGSVTADIYLNDGATFICIKNAPDKHTLTVNTDGLAAGYICNVSSVEVAEGNTYEVKVTTPSTAGLFINAAVTAGNVTPAKTPAATANSSTYTFTVTMGASDATLTLSTSAS